MIVCLSVPSNPYLCSRRWISDIVGYLIFLRRGPCAFSLSLSLTLSFSFSGVLSFCQTCRRSHWWANFLTQWVRGRSASRNPHDDHLEAGEPLQPTPYTQSSFCSSILHKTLAFLPSRHSGSWLYWGRHLAHCRGSAILYKESCHWPGD